MLGCFGGIICKEVVLVVVVRVGGLEASGGGGDWNGARAFLGGEPGRFDAATSSACHFWRSVKV